MNNGNLKYIGDFKNGKYNGYGSLFTKNKPDIYTGEFINGQKKNFGFGILTLNHGMHIGQFKDGLRQGLGYEITNTHSMVGYFNKGRIRYGHIYWKPNCDTQYFGPPIKTFGRWTQNGEMTYAKTNWPNLLSTERYFKDNKTCGLAKIIFPHDVVYHTYYNDGELNSLLLFSFHFRPLTKPKSILV